MGATGAGKTTITNLINRFYDIADGKIHYDGISINNIHKPDLRRSLGIVLQDTNLFTGTVRENIRYGNLDATDQEVEAAAALANAMILSAACPRATTLCSPAMAPISPRVSGSCWLSHGPRSPTRGDGFWMRPPAPSTPGQRPLSSRAWTP